jgi:DNA polymerase-4
LIAQEIRQRIKESVGITASAGIAPNKFIAKIASDWNKPDGQFVVRPQDVDAFVAALPVDKLYGVGRVTAAKLRRLGAETCGDLRAWSLLDLQQHFGKFGTRLQSLCRGIDLREVSPSRERKSVSVEETYVTDLPDLPACRQALPELLQRLQARIARARAGDNINKLFVKIRFDDFQRTTAECSGTMLDEAVFYRLLETGFQRRGRPVRLLGAGIGVDEARAQQDPQSGLFDQQL